MRRQQHRKEIIAPRSKHPAPGLSCSDTGAKLTRWSHLLTARGRTAHPGRRLNQLGGQRLPPSRQVFISYFFSLMTCLHMYYTLVLSCLLPLFQRKKQNAIIWIWVSFVTDSLRELSESTQAKRSGERRQLPRVSGPKSHKENKIPICHGESIWLTRAERFLKLIALLKKEKYWGGKITHHKSYFREIFLLYIRSGCRCVWELGEHGSSKVHQEWLGGGGGGHWPMDQA